MNLPSVTIVVPVYNEEKVIARTIPELLAFLRGGSFRYPFTVLIVDNASTDATWQEIEKLSKMYPEVSGLHLTEKGKGHAIRAGWKQATSDILAFMDADLSSDIRSFPALIDAVAGGSALAIGNRLGAQSKVVSPKGHRKLSSHVYNFVARAFLGTEVDDHQCGFKAITREAFATIAPELTETGFFFDTELIALTRKHKFPIHEEEILWIDSPTSKVALFSDSLRMFLSVVQLSRRLRV